MQTKRIKLTPKNIKTQAETAPAGTIRHWAGSKSCQRKLDEVDRKEENGIIYTAAASHIENINCLHCRKEHYAHYRNRRTT